MRPVTRGTRKKAETTSAMAHVKLGRASRARARASRKHSGDGPGAPLACFNRVGHPSQPPRSQTVSFCISTRCGGGAWNVSRHRNDPCGYTDGKHALIISLSLRRPDLVPAGRECGRFAVQY